MYKATMYDDFGGQFQHPDTRKIASIKEKFRGLEREHMTDLELQVSLILEGDKTTPEIRETARSNSAILVNCLV